MAVPEFSVIIPTYNRSAHVAECLRALSRIEFTGGFEVVVVDDGGTCSLDSVVEPWRRHMEVLLVRQQNAGPAAARNRGAAQARGRFLGFTDDDCRPAPKWLEALARAVRQNPECAVGGPVRNPNRDSACCAASQAILDVVYRHKNPAGADAHFLLTSNLAIAADCFESVGGFDPRFRTSEDREFCDRWLADRRRMIYVPDAVVWHEGRRGLRDFIRQHYGYGAGAYLYYGMPTLRPRTMEPFRFYAQLLAEPLRDETMRRPLVVAVLVMLSQAASACGYLSARLRK